MDKIDEYTALSKLHDIIKILHEIKTKLYIEDGLIESDLREALIEVSELARSILWSTTVFRQDP